MPRILRFPILLGLAAALPFAALLAQNDDRTQAVDVSDAALSSGALSLGPHLEFLELTGSLDDARAVPADAWRRRSETTPVFGLRNADLWMRFSIRNPGDAPRRLLLENFSRYVDYIDFYAPQTADHDGARDPDRYNRQSGGDRLIFAENPGAHRNPVFTLEVPPRSSETYYINYRTSGLVVASLLLWRAEEFHRRAPGEYALLGLYFGGMFVLFCYNAILYARSRERVYGVYSAYVAVIALYFANLNGVAAQYLFPDWPAVSNEGSLVFAALSLALAVLFAIAFLGARERFPWMTRALLVLAGASIACAFAPLSGAYALAVRLMNIFVGGGTVLLLALGVAAAIGGVRQSRYFLIGWSMFLAGSLIDTLMRLGLAPYVRSLSYSGQIGALVEVVLFSIALGDRLRIAMKDKLAAQAQLHAMQVELEIARQIQQSILPRSLPALKGARLEVLYQPLGEVGGDFYGFQQLDPERAGVLVADVAGHGVPAALDASSVRIGFSAARASAADPAALLSEMNRFLMEYMGDMRLVSGSYAFLDLTQRRLGISGAGFPAALGLCAGELREFELTGFPLGLFPDSRYETTWIDVEPGDRYFLFTDGVFERGHDRTRGMQGLELARAALEHARDSPNIAEAMLAELNRNGAATDDVTLLTITIE